MADGSEYLAKMNVFRRVAAICYRNTLKLLLLISALLLIGQLCCPIAARWWRLPSPGKIGVDCFPSNALAERVLVYLPESYRSQESWPLVVFLHGSGDRGDDPWIVNDCGTLHHKLTAVVIAPQCMPSLSWEPDAIAKLIQCVLSKYRIDRNRVYLVGFSMGGYGTWQTAAAHRELFAAIAPICGGGSPEQAKVLVDLPIWAFHGERDRVVPVAESRRMIDAIERAGGHPKLTIIPDGGHDICDFVCHKDDMWAWLLNQRR
jgi:predicted peptidase